jgi:hypothetical protein
VSAPHDAAIQAQRDVRPMSDARLRELRPYFKGPHGRELLAELDRLKRGDDRTALNLQLSINRALMDRLDALEKRVGALEGEPA